MRGIRILIVGVVALAMSAGLSLAQSLAEVAKKEKERRQTNKTESKTVVTDRELTRNYGGLPATSTTTVTSSEPGDEGETEGEPGEPGENEQQDETKTQEYWQGRVGAAKEKISNIENELNSTSSGEGQMVGVDPLGPNNLARRQEMEQRLSAARAELEAIREEARRAGAPPGWVR